MVSSNPPRPGAVLAAGLLGIAGALLVSGLLAAALGPISVDQPLEAREILDWGCRWAAVMAVALASGAAAGEAPPAGPRAAGRVMAITAGGVLALALGAAGLSILAVRLGLWGQDWGLPHRSGHAARLAALQVARISGLPAAALSAWWLVRQRRRQGRPHG